MRGAGVLVAAGAAIDASPVSASAVNSANPGRDAAATSADEGVAEGVDGLALGAESEMGELHSESSGRVLPGEFYRVHPRGRQRDPEYPVGESHDTYERRAGQLKMGEESLEMAVTEKVIDGWAARPDREVRDAASRVPEFDLKSVLRVIGVDVAYCDSRGVTVAAGVTWDRRERGAVLSSRFMGKPPVPYRFGKLGAREAGMAAEVVRGVVREGDVVMCDGHGLMHPERMGLGVHLAARLACPVVAVAKNPIHREKPRTSTERGSVQIMSDSAGIVGAELRTANAVRPVYVSTGGGMTLESAIELVLEASRYRIPEPVRLADQEARKGLRDFLGDSRSR